MANNKIFEDYIHSLFNDNELENYSIHVVDKNGKYLFFNEKHRLIIPIISHHSVSNIKKAQVRPQFRASLSGIYLQAENDLDWNESMTLTGLTNTVARGQVILQDANIYRFKLHDDCLGMVWAFKTYNYFIHNHRTIILSARETEILPFYLFGIACKKISALLDIPEHSVRQYIKRINVKFDAFTRYEVMSAVINNQYYMDYAIQKVKGCL